MRLHFLILLLKLNIFQWFLILLSVLGACDIHFLAVKNNRSILVIADVCCSCLFVCLFFFLLHHLYLIGSYMTYLQISTENIQNSFNNIKSIIKIYFMAILQDHRIKEESHFPQIRGQ